MTDDERIAAIKARVKSITPGMAGLHQSRTLTDEDIPFLLSRLSQARAVISAARKCEQCCASDQPDYDGPDNLKAALAAYDKGGEGE